jgi:hypothetical protein
MNIIHPLLYVNWLPLPFDIQQILWKINRKKSFCEKIQRLNNLINFRQMEQSRRLIYEFAISLPTSKRRCFFLRYFSLRRWSSYKFCYIPLENDRFFNYYDNELQCGVNQHY